MTTKSSDILKDIGFDMSAAQQISDSDAHVIKDVMSTLFDELMTKAHDRLCPVLGHDEFVGSIPMIIAPLLVGMVGHRTHQTLLEIACEKLAHGMGVDAALKVAHQLGQASKAASMHCFSMSDVPQDADELISLIEKYFDSGEKDG